MKIVFGGAYQGKLEYAKEAFQLEDYSTCDRNRAELDFSKQGIDHLEDFVFACVKAGMEAKDYLKQHRGELEDKVLICADISQGIVPMDKDLRAWREMTGRAMVYLCKEASSVTRVFCGLGQKIK